MVRRRILAPDASDSKSPMSSTDARIADYDERLVMGLDGASDRMPFEYKSHTEDARGHAHFALALFSLGSVQCHNPKQIPKQYTISQLISLRSD